MSEVINADSRIEAQAKSEPTASERAIAKLEQAITGHAAVSKNTLIKEAIRILEKGN